MPVILVEWVLKSEFLSKQALRPLWVLLATKYPPIHVLGFDHEHSIPGNNDMVDLGRAVGGRQSDVVHIDVGLPVQEHLLGESALYFPGPPLDKRFQ